ncbi:LPS O-antigen length regulator Wzz(fepE) [Escherichia coli]|uniref:LPS O-antigen length regulator Wzz(fepE) n=1 Tax=Escherichia coli TaxID=562 RepID=UPI003DAA0A65
MNIQQKGNDYFYKYPPPSSTDSEIDLLDIIDALWQEKIKIISIIFVFSCFGLLASVFLPQKWTSSAIVTPAEPTQLKELDDSLTSLRVLGVGVDINRDNIFNLFIKKFQSVSLLGEYLRSSPYIMDKFKGIGINELELHRAIVALSENMKAFDDSTQKKGERPLYVSWTLSFTAPSGEEAQKVLSGYIDYVSDLVAKEFMEEVRNKLEIKNKFEREMLVQDKIKIKNQLKADVKRLGYSLEVANAAGIKKPVFGNGQSVKDDPDFSVSLGSDGIASKLNIKKSISDVTELSGDLLNRQYLVDELAQVSVNDISFIPFKYQLSPSLPVKKDGVGKVIIVFVSSLMGGVIACGAVLLHRAIASRRLEIMAKLEDKLA